MVMKKSKARQCSTALFVRHQDLKGSTFRRKAECSGVLSGMLGGLTVWSVYRWLPCIAFCRRLIQRCQGDTKRIAGTLGRLVKVMTAPLLVLWTDFKDSEDPEGFHCHPPNDGTFLLTQYDAEQPDRHLPGFAWSDSDASCRVGPAIQCWSWCSSVHPHNSRPRPANSAARRKQEKAASSAAGALDVDLNGSDATAEY